MKNPTSISHVHSFCLAHNFTPSKKEGQNFLIDKNITNKMIKSIQQYQMASKTKYFVELGAGLGALTYHLTQLFPAGKSFEINPILAQHIEKDFDIFPNISIHNQDFFNTDAIPYEKYAFISNVPYSLSGKTLMWIFKNHNSISFAHLLLQKELVDRIIAPPSSPHYSRLSIYSHLLGNPINGHKVSKNCFYPQPKVSSQTVCLNLDTGLKLTHPQFKKLELILNMSFHHKRKTILNSLELSNKVFKQQFEWQNILTKHHIPFTNRPQDILPKQYLEIALELPHNVSI